MAVCFLGRKELKYYKEKEKKSWGIIKKNSENPELYVHGGSICCRCRKFVVNFKRFAANE